MIAKIIEGAITIVREKGVILILSAFSSTIFIFCQFAGPNADSLSGFFMKEEYLCFQVADIIVEVEKVEAPPTVPGIAIRPIGQPMLKL